MVVKLYGGFSPLRRNDGIKVPQRDKKENSQSKKVLLSHQNINMQKKDNCSGL